MPTKRIEDLLVFIGVRIGHFIVGAVGALLLVLWAGSGGGAGVRHRYRPMGVTGAEADSAYGLDPGTTMLLAIGGIALAGGVLNALFGPYLYNRYFNRRYAIGTLKEIRRKSKPRHRRD